MRYEVRALSRTAVVSVFVEALSEAEARGQIAAQSLQPLSVRAVNAGAGRFWTARKARVSTLLLSQELLALLEGGLTIVEAIDVLREKERDPGLRAMYAALGRGLAEGKRFSACAAELPAVFPPLYVGMLRSAERTSSLPEALARYIDYRIRVDAVRSRIVAASIYPAILAAVGLAVIVFLCTYVVPKFAAVYAGTGRPLPLLSSWLIAGGSFLQAHAALLAAGLATAGGALALWLRRGHAADVAARAARLLPFVSERIALYGLTRLYLTLGMLLEGGLPITEALAAARGTLGADARRALDRATREILNGESVSQAFERAGLANLSHPGSCAWASSRAGSARC